MFRNSNSIIQILNIVIGFFFFLSLLYSGIISIFEKEKRAAGFLFISMIIVPLIYILSAIYSYPQESIISQILFFGTIGVMIILFTPTPVKREKTVSPLKQIDERDIIFSRTDLEKDSNRFKKYYQTHPEKKIYDEKFRQNPGLLSNKAKHFDPLQFYAADSSMSITAHLRTITDGELAKQQTKLPSKQIADFIRGWAKKLGAKEVGITKLKNYHFYSHGGRGEDYGKEIKSNHKYGIVFLVEMDKKMFESSPKGPVIMESTQKYFEVGSIGVQIAEFIRNLGYSARAHIDGKYQVVCPLVAKDAGLGEIGRMGLLMSSKYGPRVRISVVTTDLNLPADEPCVDNTIIDFCKMCKKCAVNCPSNAISHDEKQKIDGIERWQINSEACYNYWTLVGTDCGKCINVCPYSHPNNLLHNFIRFGIKNSFIFRRMALILDDVFYGKKPSEKAPPKWMKSDK